MKIKNINYVSSLGLDCASASWIKYNKMKKCSYPFDWIVNNYSHLCDILSDDFEKFLDKKYYTPRQHDAPEGGCGHSLYNDYMFRHKDVMGEDYEYLVRCVERFRRLLSLDKSKLFIVENTNTGGIGSDVEKLNQILSEKTKNYHIIVTEASDDIEVHEMTYDDNVHWLKYPPNRGKTRYGEPKDFFQIIPKQKIFNYFEFEIKDDIK